MEKKRDVGLYQNIIYLTQLGISMAVPLVLGLLGAAWLRDRFGLGDWIVLVGIVLGVGTSITTLIEFINKFIRKAQKETPEARGYNKRY